MAERWVGFFDDISELIDGQLSGRIEGGVAASVGDSLATQVWQRFRGLRGREVLVRFVPADRLFTVWTLREVVEVGNAKFHKIFVRRAGTKFNWWG